VLGLTLVGVFLLWNTWVVYPLKILVVFFHELGHGLAALLTGGSIVEIQLDPREGGMAVTQGGSRFFILSAGYLGSLLIGGVILVAAADSKRDRVITAVLGGVLLLVTLLFVRPWFGFGMLFGLAAASVLLLAARFLSHEWNDFLLSVIGLTSCLYAVLDIKSDVLDRPELQSDARMLAELTGLPTVLWGLIWIALALLGTFLFVRRALRSPREGPEASDAPPA
jgi:hypothetical protein